MNNIDISKVVTQIDSITRPVEMKDRVLNSNDVLLNKIATLCSIIAEYPELKNNNHVFEKVLNFTKDIKNNDAKALRRELISHYLISRIDGFASSPDYGIAEIKNGYYGYLVSDAEKALTIQSVPPKMGRYYEQTSELVISKETLLQLDSKKFWDFIQSKVKVITIRLDNGRAITYDKKILNLLKEKRPSLNTLVEEFKLKFRDGEEIKEFHAKLLLCGDMMETKFLSGRWKLDVEPIWHLTEVPYYGFCQILKRIETDNFHRCDDYEMAADYFQFKRPFHALGGIYGKKEWEQFWGNIGDVPPLPMKLLEALDGPCPIDNKEKLDGKKMKDTHIVIYMPPSIDDKPISTDIIRQFANSPKSGGNSCKVEFCTFNPPNGDKYAKFLNEVTDKKVKGGYWLAMPLKPLEKTRELLYKDQEKFLGDNLPGYEIPSSTDVIVYALMPLVCSGEYPVRLLDSFSAVCNDREGYDLWATIGRQTSDKLLMDAMTHGYHNDMVIPALKFYLDLEEEL